MSDEFEGQGGSYVVNPKTGKRELVERTQDAADAAAGDAAGDEKQPAGDE